MQNGNPYKLVCGCSLLPPPCGSRKGWEHCDLVQMHLENERDCIALDICAIHYDSALQEGLPYDLQP